MTRRLPALDVALAATCVAVASVELAVNPAVAPKPAAAVTELLFAFTVALRRRAPLTASLLAVVASVAMALAGVPVDEPFVPLLAIVVLAYSLTTHAAVRPAVIGTLLLLTAVSAQALIEGRGIDNVLFGVTFLAAMWLMGLSVRRRTAQAVAAQVAADRLVQQRRRDAERAAAAERARIAREVHDIVGHSLSVMVVQAGAAEQMLLTAPDRAGAPVRAVQDCGREALAEMSRLLGVLREDGDEIGLAPQPRLRDLDRLLDQSNTAGVSVDLTITGTERPLPPGVDLAVYRIVQESLTNVRKHAVAVCSTVRLHYGPDTIAVVVADPGPPSTPSHGSGHGLAGMRERVAFYGGTLEASPTDRGGFAVRAVIPTRPAR